MQNLIEIKFYWKKFYFSQNSIKQTFIKTNDIERRIYNNEIEEIFSKISNETVLKLGKDLSAHPKKYILRIIRAPPVTIRPDIKKIKNGILGDIAPTILQLAGIEQPAEMTGESLLK